MASRADEVRRQRVGEAKDIGNSRGDNEEVP
jgi:hypothetical protein